MDCKPSSLGLPLRIKGDNLKTQIVKKIFDVYVTFLLG